MTTWTNLVRSEIRKLTTTPMPLGFVAVFIVLAVLNGVPKWSVLLCLVPAVVFVPS